MTGSLSSVYLNMQRSRESKLKNKQEKGRELPALFYLILLACLGYLPLKHTHIYPSSSSSEKNKSFIVSSVRKAFWTGNSIILTLERSLQRSPSIPSVSSALTSNRRYRLESIKAGSTLPFIKTADSGICKSYCSANMETNASEKPSLISLGSISERACSKSAEQDVNKSTLNSIGNAIDIIFLSILYRHLSNAIRIILCPL